MIDLACRRAERLLERRACGLGPADALILEEHLSSCGRCTEQARLLSALRSVVNGMDVTLSMSARERVIDRAWQAAPSHEVDKTPVRSWQAWGGVVLVAAALFGFFVRGAVIERGAAPLAHNEASAPAPLSVADGATLQATSASGPLSFALAHAKVDLQPGSSARWNAGAHDLALISGSVVVDVDPRLQQAFSVSTPSFRVQVLGTRFTVALREVSVERGRVRVVAPDGHEVRVLVAGQRFSAADGGNVLAPVAPLVHEAHEATDTDEAHGAGHASERSAEPHRAHVDGALLLSEARTQLADRQLERARLSVDAALSAQLAPSERAEAMTLRAECALMAGDHAAAVQAYLRVARSFAQLPAGENALFSAARLEMERGRNQEAQRWLQQYLARYPQGRFVKETRLRLRTLGAPSDHAP